MSHTHTQFYVYIHVHKAIIYFGKIYWVAGSTSFRDQKGCLDVSHHLLQTLWGMLAPAPPVSTTDQAAGHSPQSVALSSCIVSLTLRTAPTVTYCALSLGKLKPLEWTGLVLG